MNKELLVTRISALCKARNISKTKAFIESGVGKNFESNLRTSEPSKKNLDLLAKYFNVPVDFLTGDISEEVVTARAVGEMLEWLEDNDFEIDTTEYGEHYIAKDGKYIYLTDDTLQTESRAVKIVATDGYELAMLDWVNRMFGSPTDLSLQEQQLITLFRSTTEEGRLEMIAALINVKDKIEKKTITRNSGASGGTTGQ